MNAAKPVCFVPGREIPEIYSGVPTFMGLPKAAAAEELKGSDVAVIGAPWEGIVTWSTFSGCELAPKYIREASVRYSGFMPENGFDIFDYLNVKDFGDCPSFPGTPEVTLEAIQSKVSEALRQGVFPVLFGGDHSVTVPAVRALAETTGKKIGVVHLDSHMDNMPDYGGNPNARCSPLHQIYNIPGVDPRNVIHVGVRGPRNNPRQVEIAREVGATVLTGFDVKRIGIEETLRRAIEVVSEGTDAVYVTVCSDVLDVAFNPGGPPDINGMTSFELSYLLRGLATHGIDAFDFVEIYPPNDRNNVSGHTAVWMALYVMAGIVRQRFDVPKDD